MEAKHESQIVNLRNKVQHQDQEIDAKARIINDLRNELRMMKDNINQDSKTFEDEILSTRKQLSECKNNLHAEQSKSKLLETSLVEYKQMVQEHENQIGNQNETIKLYKTKLAERENQSAQEDSKVESTTANNQVEEKAHNQSNAPTGEALGKGSSEKNIALDIDMQAEKEPYTGRTGLGKTPSLNQESVAGHVIDVPTIIHQDPSDTVSRSELDAARDQILDLKSSIQELKSEVKNKEKEILEKNTLLHSLSISSDVVDKGVLKKEHLSGVKSEKSPGHSMHAAEVTKLQHEIAVLKSTLAKKEESLSDYEEMMQKYKDEISVLRNVIVEKTNSIKDMENKIMSYNKNGLIDNFHLHGMTKSSNDKKNLEIQTSKNEDMVETSIAKSIICTEEEEEASVSHVAVGSSDTSAEGSDAKLTFLNNALTQKENMLKSACNKIEFLEKKLELRSRELAEANLSALSDRSAGVLSGITTKNMPTQTVLDDKKTFNSPSLKSYLMTSATESIDLQQAKTYIQKLEDDVTLMKKQYRSDLKQQAHAIENLMSTVEGLELSRSQENQNRIAINTFTNLQKRNKELEDRLDSKSEEVSVLKVELQKLKFSKESYEKRLANAHSQLSQFSTMVEKSAKPTEILHDNLREMVDRIKLLEVEKKFMLSRMQEQALMIHRLSVEEEKREGLIQT